MTKGEKHFNFTHGMTDTPPFRCWQGAKNRCYNKRAKNYDRYGGRGIKMCGSWKDDFVNFWEDMRPAWEIAEKEWEGEVLSLARINEDGDYTKTNCCFIPRRLNVPYPYRFKNMKKSATI